MDLMTKIKGFFYYCSFSRYVRRWKVWKWAADYFPVTLIKTADLDPKRKYILGNHPHGVLCFGFYLAVVTDALNWDRTFHNIKRRIATLKLIFWLPLLRDVALASGAISASKESFNHVLSDQEGGNLIAVIVGGAQEALFENVNDITIILKKRQGFIRLALQNGADLVPSFSFGEHKVYKIVSNPEGSFLRGFQEWFKKWVTFSPVIFNGRGLFQYT